MDGEKWIYMKGIILLIPVILISCSNEPANKIPGEKKKSDSAVITNSVADTINKNVWEPLVYDTSKKYIYLTFDDGPQNGTSACMNLCKKLGVKATFFMVGEHVMSKRLQGLVDSIRNAYPNLLLANHSYTHAANDKYKFFYQHPQIAGEDFFKAQESLKVPYKIIRLPGNNAWVTDNGIKSSKMVRDVCNELDSADYNVIGWDAEWRFSHDRKCRPVGSPEKLAGEVINELMKKETHTKNHIIVLAHDRMFQRPEDAEELLQLILLLKQNPNVVFETIDHYPGLDIKGNNLHKPLRGNKPHKDSLIIADSAKI